MSTAATTRYGPALFPDSALYLSSADSLRAGRGYMLYDDRPYTIAPPLFPTLLAISGLLGVAPRFVNALAFGGTVFVSGRLLLAYFPCRVGLVVAGSVVLSPVLLGQSVALLTESVFTFLLITTTLALERYLTVGARRWLIVAAIVAGLACLQRYLGVSAVIGGSVALLLWPPDRRHATRDRLTDVAVFGAIALTPVAAWLIRNHLVTSRLDERLAALTTVAAAFDIPTALADAVSAWFLPNRLALGWRAAALVAVAFMILVPQRARRGIRDEACCWRLRLPITLSASYVAMLSAIAYLYPLTQEMRRLLSPVYVWTLMILFGAVVTSVQPRRFRRGLAAIAGGLAVAWLAYSAERVTRDMAWYVQRGAGAYTTPEWRASPTMAWLRQTRLDLPVYSNVPDAIYLLTGRHARFTPWRAEGVERIAGASGYLVWVNLKPMTSILFGPAEVSRVVSVQPWLTFADGAVFLLGTREDARPISEHAEAR